MAKRGSKPGNGPDSHAGNGKHVVLTFDPANANTHSDASLGAVRRSVDRLGAGRSIVADASGTLIAGEATLRAAQDLGVPVRIVETDGSELVAVVRTDMGPDDPRRHALAIADNQTARLSEFDPERLADSLRGLGDYQDLLDATGFDADALAGMLGVFDADGIDAPTLASGDREPFQQMTFTLHDTQAETVKAAIEHAKAAGPFDGSPNENSNGNALARIAEAYRGPG